MMLKATSGMTHIYISYAQIKEVKCVLQQKQYLIYWNHVMLQHIEDILGVIEQLPKLGVTNVNEQGT